MEAMDESPPLADRYRITQWLGEGSHGRVCRALDLQHGRDVVLKIRAVDPAHRDEVLAEARVLLSLQPHPSLPLIRDDFFIDDTHVLVLDTVVGTSMADMLANTGDPGLGPSTVVGYLEQVAAALDHLHTHVPPVVHGDVSPANCVVTPAGAVVLVDFGTAGGARHEGTRGFLAPEVAAGQRPSPASDVFSLAATAVALVSGSAPTGGVPEFDGVDPASAEAWIRGLRRGLAIDPERRPRSASELVDRVRHALGRQLPDGVVTFVVVAVAPLDMREDSSFDAATSARRRCEQLVAEIAESHGGHYLGGGADGATWAMVFPDAAAAVRASAEIVVPADEAWPIQGVGLASGAAALADGRYYGPALALAVEVGLLAHAGQVVATRATAELVRHASSLVTELNALGDHRLASKETAFLYQVGPGGQFPALRQATLSDEHNLPAEASRFIGREEELSKVAELLHQARAVTLSGAGGVGKTRLALAAASHTVGTVRDGVWLVELALLGEPELVVPAVARVLNVELDAQSSTADALASLAEGMRNRRLLLVLDNCEHVTEICAQLVTELLARCPEVRVLATSRSPLHVDGEHVWHVPVMRLPEGAVVSTREVAGSDAVELFVARVRSFDQSFDVDNRNVSSVVSICQRLDGLPLAIELATARLRSMGISELEERLDSRLHLLAAQHRDGVPHHQTLWATIDWSYRLLGEVEQRLFRRLAVCPGIFDLATAEAVGEGLSTHGPATAAVLGSLVEKSLVQVERDRFGTRYRMLETIRQFAAARLEVDAAEHRSAQVAFAHRILEFAEDPAHDVALHPEAFARMAADLTNVETALMFLRRLGDAECACRLFIAVGDLWFFYRREAMRSIESILEPDLDVVADPLRVEAQTMILMLVPYSHPAYAPVLADTMPRANATDDALLVMKARLAEMMSQMDRFQARGVLDLEELIGDIRPLGDRALLHQSLLFLGQRSHEGQLDPREALREIIDAGGDSLYVGEAHYQLAARLIQDGELDAALVHLRAGEAFDIQHELAPSARPTDYLGDLQLKLGLNAEAMETYVTGFRNVCRSGRRNLIALVALKIARSCLACGDAPMAALLLGFSDAQMRAFGSVFFADETPVIDEVESGLRRFGDVRANKAEGAAMLVGDMLDRVLDWYEEFAGRSSVVPAVPARGIK